MKEWDKTITNDLSRLCNREVELSDFVNLYWERFKPVYISVYKFIENDGDVYTLVYKFFSKISRSDVQPLFQSDNQLFSYFKISVKNDKYDQEHKKEISTVLFSEFENQEDDDSENYFENSIIDDGIPMDEMLSSEMAVQNLFKKLSEVLSESYIQVIVLLYRGYTPKEIRKELGISYATVNDRIWTIRNTLREQFGITEKNFTLD